MYAEAGTRELAAIGRLSRTVAIQAQQLAGRSDETFAFTVDSNDHNKVTPVTPGSAEFIRNLSAVMDPPIDDIEAYGMLVQAFSNEGSDTHIMEAHNPGTASHFVVVRPKAGMAPR